MSFSFNVKNEILNNRHTNACCKVSELYGMLAFSTKFSKNKIFLITENENIADYYYCVVLKKIENVGCTISRNNRTYLVTVSNIQKIVDIFGDPKVFNNEIINANCTSCSQAFIRGAFLAGGTISNPNKEYHLEFACKNLHFCESLIVMLNSFNLDAKMHKRNRQFVVYIKDSENIEDLLTLLGATRASLTIMNTKIIKGIRNKANRINNFETANIKKTAVSCVRHLIAIEKLEKHGVLYNLPNQLYQIAIARRDNIDLSLKDLAVMFGLSRSGINHRLNKIIEIANNIEKNK